MASMIYDLAEVGEAREVKGRNLPGPPVDWERVLPLPSVCARLRLF